MICNISLLVILTCKIDKTVCYSNCNFYRNFKVSPKVNIPVIRNLLVFLRDPQMNTLFGSQFNVTISNLDPEAALSTKDL